MISLFVKGGTRGIFLFLLPLQLIAGPALPPLFPDGENLDDFPGWAIDENAIYNSIDFSPDGKLIATGSYSNHTIKLWDVNNRRLVHTLNNYSTTYSLSFSPDGKTLASGTGSKYIRLWNTSNKTSIGILEGHTGVVNSVSFSPDGKKLVSGSSDKTVKIWDISTKTVLHSLDGHSGNIFSVNFSPDGKIFASGSEDKTIKLWDTQTRRLLHTFEGHTNRVSSISFSPDGKILASGSYDRTINLWDLQTKKLLNTINGHSGSISEVAFSPDGKILASSAYDKTIRLWDAQTRRLLHTFTQHNTSAISLSFSPNSETFASGSQDKTLRLWSTSSKNLLHTFKGGTNTIYSTHFSPDGTTFATGAGDNTVRLWDTQTKRLLHTFYGHTNVVRSIRYSPDGKTVVSASWDGDLKTWDIKTKRLLSTIAGGSAYTAIYSPDGKKIAANGTQRTVRILDSKTLNILHTLDGHSSDVASVSFSPTGKILASASYDKTIKFWDTETGKVLYTSKEQSEATTSLSFSPNGKILAAGSHENTIKLWDTDTKDLLHTFKSHNGDVNSVSFSQDGKILASGSSDYTVKLWNIDTKSLLTDFKARHSGYVYSVDFSADGQTLISGSGDGTVKHWDLKGNLLHTFISGQNDSWLSHDGRRFQRSNDDNLLLIKKDQDWIPAPPKPGNWNEIQVSAITHQHKTPLDMWIGKTSEITLEVSNLGKHPLYWPKVQLAPDSSFNLHNPDNAIPIIIAPGKAQQISLKVSPHLGAKIEPRNDSLRFKVAFPEQIDTNWSTIPVAVHAPLLVLRETALLRDHNLLQVRVDNIGTQTIRNLYFDLNPPGLPTLDIQNIRNPIQAGAFIERSFLIPKNAPLPEKLDMNLDIRNADLPLMTWNFGSPKSALPQTFQWMYIALALLSLLGLLGIFYFRRYRHPLLVNLSEHPQKLLELPIEQLPEAQQRLRQTKRLSSVLSEAMVSEATLQKALDFQKLDEGGKAEYLALRLGTAPEQGNSISLKTLTRFPLNIDKLQLSIPKETAPEDLLRELKTNPVTSNNITLIIGPDSDYQRKLYNTTRDLSNKWVAPQGIELTRLLLSPDPENTLAEILAGQLSLQQISPYKTGGGVHNESTFFGRRELIAQITNRDPSNYLIVGGRQLGKSTLLQALDRRYADNPQVECHYTSLSNEILIPRLASVLKFEKTNDPEIFAEQLEALIRQNNQHYIFLIDEADKFIEHEKEQGYAILNVFRRLSEQGNCTFILTGFWQLYQHAVLDYQSPIRNFGEPLSIGELEKPACIELVTVPMKRMNLHWNDSALVEQLVEACGQRANLIAIACQHIVRNLPPQQRNISAGDMHKALHSDEIRRALTGWVVGVSEEEQTYERMVVYATIEQQDFSTADLLDMAQQRKLQLDTQQLEKTLSRLELAFILGRNEGRWFYRVPLFVDYIKEDAPVAKLATELNRLSNSQFS